MKKYFLFTIIALSVFAPLRDARADDLDSILDYLIQTRESDIEAKAQREEEKSRELARSRARLQDKESAVFGGKPIRESDDVGISSDS